jgi:predicted RNase H-like HicB family nuclease
MYRFLVIIEPGPNNYSAYVPDLPGCIATGKTLEEVKKNMQEAISMHLEGMLEDNEPIPSSSSLAEYMDVPSPTSAA